MDVTIPASTGRATGSRPSNRLRVEGHVPGVVYGLGRDPVPVVVERRDLRHALTTEAGLNAVITLEVGDAAELCIVKVLQRHPVRNEVIHVDFLRVDVTKEITVDVPIVLTGEAHEVTIEQGIVEQVAHTLAVHCKPGAIPNELHFDISELRVGDTVRVSDLPLPAGVRTEVDPEELVATTAVTRAEPAAGEEGEAAATGEATEAAADAAGDEEAAGAEGSESSGEADDS